MINFNTIKVSMKVKTGGFAMRIIGVIGAMEEEVSMLIGQMKNKETKV